MKLLLHRWKCNRAKCEKFELSTFHSWYSFLHSAGPSRNTSPVKLSEMCAFREVTGQACPAKTHETTFCDRTNPLIAGIWTIIRIPWRKTKVRKFTLVSIKRSRFACKHVFCLLDGHGQPILDVSIDASQNVNFINGEHFACRCHIPTPAKKLRFSFDVETVSNLTTSAWVTSLCQFAACRKIHVTFLIVMVAFSLQLKPN